MADELRRSWVAADLTIRADEGGDGRTICGIVVPFGEQARVADGFGPAYVEEFQRGAFTKTLAERRSPVKLLMHHDPTQPIGVATMLEERDEGLYGEFRVAATRAGDDGLELVRSGTLDGFSIGFIPVSHVKRGGVTVRTEVKFRETSLVTFPAYESAGPTGVRSDDAPAEGDETAPEVVPDAAPAERDAATPDEGAGTGRPREHLGRTYTQRCTAMRANQIERQRIMGDPILTARLAEIETERRSIHEAAGEAALTTEQESRWSQLDADEAEVRSAIEAAERAERVAESRRRWGTVHISMPSDDFADLGRIRQMSEADVISRAMSAVESVRYSGLRVSDEHRAAALERIESIPGAAEYALVHAAPAYMSAFRSWLASQGMPVYTAEEAAAVRTAMSLTSANGGYALPTLLDPTLIHTGAATKNPIRRLARVEQGTVNVWNGVTVGNVTTAWKGEGSAFTEGSPTFGGVSVTAAALTAYVTASYEIFQDTGLQGQLPGLIGEAIDYAESAAFVSGSGSTAPKGVITAVSGTAGSLVTVTTRGSFTAASGADTLALFNALATRYEDSSTWVANRATFLTIQQQVVGTYGTMLDQMVLKGELLGLPIAKASSVTATTTSGNILAVLGDFRQYVIYDRIGVNLEFIPNVVDGSGVPTGQRGLVAYKRVGGDVSDVNAFRLLKA